jgi:DNA-binding transcriptional MerR regulator
VSSPLHVGALAARSGRSTHTIRWYDSQGLIPGVQRDRGGRRVFDEAHVGWLLLMDRLRRTGMSIAQMRRYTQLVKQGRATLRERREFLKAHRMRVETTIREWTAALSLLDEKIDFYGEWLATGRRPATEPGSKGGRAIRQPPRLRPGPRVPAPTSSGSSSRSSRTK